MNKFLTLSFSLTLSVLALACGRDGKTEGGDLKTPRLFGDKYVNDAEAANLVRYQPGDVVRTLNGNWEAQRLSKGMQSIQYLAKADDMGMTIKSNYYNHPTLDQDLALTVEEHFAVSVYSTANVVEKKVIWKKIEIKSSALARDLTAKKFCGFNYWQAGVAYDISYASCKLDMLFPVANLSNIDAENIIYSRYYRSSRNALVLGGIRFEQSYDESAFANRWFK